MKKILFIVSCIAMTGVMNVDAKKKTKNAEPQPAPLELKSVADSISFAAGMAQTEGLLPYLKSQLNVDTAYMADFIQGLVDAKSKCNDPRFVAYQAGESISQMVLGRMVPGINNEMKSEGDTLNPDLFYAGFLAALKKDTTVYTNTIATNKFRSKMQEIQKAKEAKAKAALELKKKEGEAWLAENAKKEGVITTPSGLQYKVITEGNGIKPLAEDEVTVRYEGKLIDGTVFDSSYKRKDPDTKFRCNQVIKGWTEALTMMPQGSKWELYIPQDLAYGERAQGSIPAYSVLIFTVELVSVNRDEKPAEAAPKAKKTPAKKTAKKK